MGTLTFFFKGYVTTFFPDPLDPDSLTFRETLVKVWNEILVRLKESGNKLTGQDLEVIGFALRRVYFVAEAYKSQRQEFPLTVWMEKLAGIGKDAGVGALGL